MPIQRLALAAVAVTVGGLVTTVVSADATPSGNLVIGEAYGGGGNSGATFKNDFVELANRGTGAASVAGYSVQYISASPTVDTRWSVTPLSGAVAPGKSFLIAEAAGAGGTESLPEPDATGTSNLSGTAGTVALVRSTAPLTCKSAVDCAGSPDVIDLVGWGSAAIREGNSAPQPTNATSVQRRATADTDDNAADFGAAAPTPTNGGTTNGGTTDPGVPGALRIHDVQGPGWTSPHNGETVTDLPGVVTAVRTGSSKGFWLQDPTPDADPRTSEGVLVYTGATPTVKPGDSVLVSGKVSDYYALAGGETLSSTSSLSVTEITGPTVRVQSSGNALPAPVAIDPPATYAPDLGGANIEQTPLDPTRSALDYYESIEGMRAQVTDVRVVGPSNQYGEQYVTTKPTQAATPRGGTVLTGDNKIPSGRLEVAAPSGRALGLDVGDHLAGATVGVIDWSTFGGYVLQADTLGTAVKGNLPPVTAKPGTRKQLSIATYNVENLKPADSDAKFAALAKGVVSNLASPDIVALEEIQDNSGATADGTIAADQTLAKLTAAIRTAGGPAYGYRQIDPQDGRDGGQPGGNIRVAFLFDPTRVSFVDRGTAGADRTTTGTDITTVHGRAALTLSPGRIDPANPVWTDSRKPLAGEFRFGTKSVIVVANHWNSKGGDQNADGRFQYPKQSSRVQRAGQAQVVHEFVRRILETERKANVVVVGDLNDYQFSPPLASLRTGTADGTGQPILTDLITTLPAEQQYTYVYNGVSQVLDHILVSPAIRKYAYQVVHVNAEYSAQVSDHDPQVVDIAP